MIRPAGRSILGLVLFAAATVLFSGSAPRPQGPTDVTLNRAVFNGLTRIAVTASVPLTGLDAASRCHHEARPRGRPGG